MERGWQMIELPFPAKILWPNGRGHHMAKHRAFQKHKQWAFVASKAARVSLRAENVSPVNGSIKWFVTIHPKTRNAVDDDNARASLKAYQDGLALALGVDDKLFNAPKLTFGEPIKGGLVRITIDAA
jgi:crossover junction endodeoxyribonuclease RusA